MTGKERCEELKLLIPLGEKDSLLLRPYHAKRVYYESCDTRVIDSLRVVGLAHAIFIANGLHPPDSVTIQLYRRKRLEENGWMAALVPEGAKTVVSSPGRVMALSGLRSFTVRQCPGSMDTACNSMGAEDYVLTYDHSGLIVTSPRLVSVYLPRDVLKLLLPQPHGDATQKAESPAQPPQPKPRTIGPTIGPKPTH